MAEVVPIKEGWEAGEFFSWAEFERTSQPYPNEIPAVARVNIRLLVQRCLDPLRRRLDRPVRVTSGYRSAAVNEAVGGHPQSWHKYGLAADIKVAGMTSVELLKELWLMEPNVTTIIGYAPERGGHVHVDIDLGREGRRWLWAPPGGGYVPAVGEVLT